MRLISYKAIINALKMILSALEREYEFKSKEKIDKCDFTDVNQNSD